MRKAPRELFSLSISVNSWFPCRERRTRDLRGLLLVPKHGGHVDEEGEGIKPGVASYPMSVWVRSAKWSMIIQ